jgi:glycosyltransferase involved in cell wall biosynthesis
MSPRLTLSMIVKNEARNVAACIGSVRSVVDELVVVDTGSTDETQDIVRSFGGRVLEVPWTDDFAAARNASLDLATSDWVFWLDGDERLDEKSCATLAEIKSGLERERAAYLFVQVNILSDGNTNEVGQVRLFPKDPQIRWRYRVHEQIGSAAVEAGLPLKQTGVRVAHEGFARSEVRAQKLARNLRILERELEDRPDDGRLLYLRAQALLEGRRIAEALEELERYGRQVPPDRRAPRWHLLRAECQMELGRFNDALRSVRAGRAIAPNDVEHLFFEAQVLMLLDEANSAEALLRQILMGGDRDLMSAYRPEILSFQARFALVISLVQQDRWDEGQIEMRHLSALSPREVLAHSDLAQMFETHARSRGRTSESGPA